MEKGKRLKCRLVRYAMESRHVEQTGTWEVPGNEVKKKEGGAPSESLKKPRLICFREVLPRGRFRPLNLQGRRDPSRPPRIGGSMWAKTLKVKATRTQGRRKKDRRRQSIPFGKLWRREHKIQANILINERGYPLCHLKEENHQYIEKHRRTRLQKGKRRAPTPRREEARHCMRRQTRKRRSGGVSSLSRPLRYQRRSIELHCSSQDTTTRQDATSPASSSVFMRAIELH